jgi:hypothetical protein
MPAIVRRPTPRSGNRCISPFAVPSANRAFSRHPLFEILRIRKSCIFHSCSLPCFPMYRCLYAALRRLGTLINFTATSSPAATVMRAPRHFPITGRVEILEGRPVPFIRRAVSNDLGPMLQHSLSSRNGASRDAGHRVRATFAKPAGSKLRNASWSCDVSDDFRAVAQQAPDRRDHRRRNLIRTRSRGHACE